jgi:hypothetical protein
MWCSLILSLSCYAAWSSLLHANGARPSLPHVMLPTSPYRQMMFGCFITPSWCYTAWISSYIMPFCIAHECSQHELWAPQLRLEATCFLRVASAMLIFLATLVSSFWFQTQWRRRVETHKIAYPAGNWLPNTQLTFIKKKLQATRYLQYSIYICLPRRQGLRKRSQNEDPIRPHTLCCQANAAPGKSSQAIRQIIKRKTSMAQVGAPFWQWFFECFLGVWVVFF